MQSKTKLTTSIEWKKIKRKWQLLVTGYVNALGNKSLAYKKRRAESKIVQIFLKWYLNRPKRTLEIFKNTEARGYEPTRIINSEKIQTTENLNNEKKNQRKVKRKFQKKIKDSNLRLSLWPEQFVSLKRKSWVENLSKLWLCKLYFWVVYWKLKTSLISILFFRLWECL